MSADFLIELGTEELPPKALLSLSEAFTSGVVAGLRDRGLNFGAVRSFAAPRRLAITIADLDQSTPDKDLVIWGPPTKVAFGDDGKPSRAAEAFANKNGLELSGLKDFVENDGQQDKLCVRRTESGVQTRELLAEIINGSLAALPIPKRMRWGDKKEEFVRPVQWAVLIYDGKVCNDLILGLTAGNKSRGHRFHANTEIVIQSPQSYEQQLREAFVIADFEARKSIIKDGVHKLAKEIGGHAQVDDGLLNEVEAAARRAGEALDAIDAVMAVGGGSAMPWVQQWLQHRLPKAPLLVKQPLQAVVLGALAMTPALQVMDVLQHGISLRCWDRRLQSQRWHPLFLPGQAWPTPQPLELVLASRDDQRCIEIQLGTPGSESRAEVVFVDGMPVLRQQKAGEASVRLWSQEALQIPLPADAKEGQDCLRLRFGVDADRQLWLEGFDLLGEQQLSRQILGIVE